MKIKMIGILYSLLVFFTISTSWSPDFLIIGEQKCGTSSLFANLVKHPKITSKPGQKYRLEFKELFFFTRNFHKGLEWYKQQFPEKNNCLIGEASTDYLCDIRVPQLVKSFFPEVKLIVIMRNPIDRAFSHFHHEKKGRRETKTSFEQAILINAKHIGEKAQSFFSGTIDYNESNLDQYIGNDQIVGDFGDYLRRGIYAENISRWFQYFPKENFLFVFFEDYILNPYEVLNKLYKFLGIEEFYPDKLDTFLIGTYKEKINKRLKKELKKFYKVPNSNLEQLINLKLPWQKNILPMNSNYSEKNH